MFKIAKIPHNPTLMIQAGSKLWFIHARHVLGLVAALAALTLSSCASMQGKGDSSYTIDRYGNTSDGAQFVPSEGNIARDTAGRYYYKTNAGSAYESITTSTGQTCRTSNAGTAYARVICY